VLAAVAALAFVGGAATGWSGAETQPQSSSSRPAPEWLYVLDAGAGSADATTLTLEQTDDSVDAFTDRPEREAKQVALRTLVSGWDEVGFGDDPPNASLTFQDESGEQVRTIEIAEPRLEGDTLTFRYRLLSGDGARATATLPVSFGALTLVVDDSPGPPQRGGGAVLGDTAGTGPSDATLVVVSRDAWVTATAGMSCAEDGSSKVCDRVEQDADGQQATWTAYLAIQAVGQTDIDVTIQDLDDLSGQGWSFEAEGVVDNLFVRLQVTGLPASVSTYGIDLEGSLGRASVGYDSRFEKVAGPTYDPSGQNLSVRQY
jgi:hypothetical protein